MKLFDQLKLRFSELKSARGTWENHWQEVAEVFQPRHATFTAEYSPGQKRNFKVYDSEPLLMPDRFSAAMESLMTPRSQKWHSLSVVSDPDLNDYAPVRQWIDDVVKTLFRYRYRAKSGFDGAIKESYGSLALYGTQTLYVEEGTRQDPLSYRNIFLGETYIDDSFTGIVDTMFRGYDMTARQAAQRWGENNLAPEMIKALGEKSQSTKKFPFLSAVLPDLDAGIVMPNGQTNAVFHLDLTHERIVGSGGYYEFPYLVSRFSQAANEIYGRGPGIFVLQQAKILNAKARTVLRMGEKAVDPPQAAADTSDLYRLDLNAGAVNYGAIDKQGNMLVKPMELGAKVLLGREEMERDQEQIREAFWVTLFQILAENPSMTATEVLERAKEKAELIGPAIGKQETELIGPMVEREIAILWRKELLPPPPPEMAGQELEVEYTSPMSRMRRAADGAAIARTLEYATAAASFDPGAMDRLDLPESVKEMALIQGVPAKLIRSDQQLAAIQEQRAEAEALAQQAQLMESMSKSAGDASGMVKALGEVAQ